MADNVEKQPSGAAAGGGRRARFFADTLPIEQRTLLGTLVFFAIILIVGWTAINESQRMQTFTKQYEGRSIARGAVIFDGNCRSCHGADGRGLAGVAPAVNAPDMFDGTRLQEVGWTGSLYDYIYLTVAAGRPVRSADWPQAMPTWSQDYGGPMRPDEVRDVVNYVMNYARFYEEGYEAPGPVAEAPTATPEPAFAAVGLDLTSELPAGDPARGEALFSGAQNAPDGAVLACNACHSLDGSVLVGPTMQGIANKALPEGYDSLAAYLRESIQVPEAYKVPGFEAVNMPANFGDRLDAQSLSDLIAYLLTLN
jgi:mono/diheme cytochrome c family protein